MAHVEVVKHCFQCPMMFVGSNSKPYCNNIKEGKAKGLPPATTVEEAPPIPQWCPIRTEPILLISGI